MFKDCCFPANVPRVFTRNATSPEDFHGELLARPWGVSDEARCSWGAGVKAVFRRAWFALVEPSMVSGKVRAEHQKRRRSGDV